MAFAYAACKRFLAATQHICEYAQVVLPICNMIELVYAQPEVAGDQAGSPCVALARATTVPRLVAISVGISTVVPRSLFIS